MPIVWRDTLSVDDAFLDQQHRSIINTINMLEKARETRTFPIVEKIFANVLPYFTKHFRDEEAHLDHVQFAERDEHKQIHTDLLKRADELVKKFQQAPDEQSGLVAAEELERFLVDYLFDHIVKEDMKVKSGEQVEIDETPVSMAALNEKTEENRTRRREERDKDLEYDLPFHLQHLLKRLDYVAPDLPAPRDAFPSFEMLCEAAILRRLDKVLLFFQRYNPDLKRELKPFFLSSPQFRTKLQEAVRQFVLTKLWESRQIRTLSASLDLSKVNDETFWDVINHTLRANILECWQNGWEELMPVAARKEDGSKVLKIKDNLKQLREMLQPDNPEDYDMPKVGTQELMVFTTLLDTKEDWWELLNKPWKVFVDLYEQEKDPRIYQERAREGALRDYMLQSFNSYPTEWLDFILLASYRVFPRISTRFIDNFTTNYQNREKVLPFTMRFLEQAREKPEIMFRELREEQAYNQEREELRKVLAHREG